jgi:hypothetical protein
MTDEPRARMLEPVEYFKIKNSQLDRSIRNAGFYERASALEAAFDEYFKLENFLTGMGCTVTIGREGELGNSVPRIYGGMVPAIAASRDDWLFSMEQLLPVDQGWEFEAVLSNQVERAADGRIVNAREAIKAKLASGSMHPTQVDALVHENHLPDLNARFRRWLSAGRSIDLYHRLGRRSERRQGSERIEWLVQDLIPFGMVVLVAGPREVGKSTLMLELAVAIATDGTTTWLGQALENRYGLAVILTGEDTDAVINSRLERLDPDDEARRIVVYALDGRPLTEIADEIARIPFLSLVVVDPARRYIEGDEDGSGHVSEFFAILESLVQRTCATVIVVHHLTKNAAPSTLQQVRETVRGSGVFLDRPRVVLGCFRRGETTVLGRIKSNLPPEFPIKTAFHLHRDPATLRHVPQTSAEPIEAEEVGNKGDLKQKILTAVRGLSATGEKVTRAGDNELWSKHVPALEGIGRNRIRTTIDQLIADGLLVASAQGIRAVP